MIEKDKREVWQRGPIPGIAPLLQPVAHALLQAREEVEALMEGYPDERLWERPGSMAAPGFHLQHLTGVLDRLFTYARGEMLDPGQLRALAEEGVAGRPVRELVEAFRMQVDRALLQLENTPESSLTEARGIGRDRIPTTVIGLLVHAAEHTQRHNGQLLVTVKVILAGSR